MRNAVIATTTVKLLSDSSNRVLKIAELLTRHGHVQEEEEVGALLRCPNPFARTPMCLVYAPSANSNIYWSSTWAGCLQEEVRDVLIPSNVRELCNRCFCECTRLRRVNFGSSSSLEWIGESCFEGSGVEAMSIPDSVRELCDGCFKGCKSLRRVNFGCCSSLERIGRSCFEDSGVEDVSIPDGVRELCDGCFKGCESVVRVTFGWTCRFRDTQYCRRGWWWSIW